jgi:hypothetical protein
MVRRGDFIVEIVEAESKSPFKEHTRNSDGTVFVEVEPNIEYFVRIKRAGDIVCSCQSLFAAVLVDGQNMGALWSWDKGNRHSVYAGLWKRNRQDGVETIRALQVFEPTQRISNSSAQGSNYVTGKVEVQISERIFSGKYETSRSSSGSFKQSSDNFKQCSVLECSRADRKKDKKLLRSRLGSTTTERKSSPTGSKPLFNKGKLLETITLQYCSTVGLIEVGVLERPASWGKKRPHSSPASERAYALPSAVTPQAETAPSSKKIRVETVVTSQESTFIDLSELPSDDEGNRPGPKRLFS